MSEEEGSDQYQPEVEEQEQPEAQEDEGGHHGAVGDHGGHHHSHHSVQEKEGVMNLKYFQTKTALYKLMALALGLLAWTFTATAYSQAAYNVNLKCKSQPSGTPNYMQPCEGPTDFTCHVKQQIVVYCNDLSAGSSEGCTFRQKVYKKYLDAKKNRTFNQELTLNETYAGVALYEPTNGCPVSGLLVMIPVLLIVVTWLASLIMIIVLICVDLNKKNKFFSVIDYFGHIVAAVVSGFSAVCVVGFLVWVFYTNYPCEDDESANCPNMYVGEGCAAAYYVYGFHLDPMANPSIVDLMLGQQTKFATCMQRKNATYKIYYLIFGAIFLLATAYCQARIACMLGRQRPRKSHPHVVKDTTGGHPIPQQASPVRSKTTTVLSPSKALVKSTPSKTTAKTSPSKANAESSPSKMTAKTSPSKANEDAELSPSKVKASAELSQSKVQASAELSPSKTTAKSSRSKSNTNAELSASKTNAKSSPSKSNTNAELSPSKTNAKSSPSKSNANAELSPSKTNAKSSPSKSNAYAELLSSVSSSYKHLD